MFLIAFLVVALAVGSWHWHLARAAHRASRVDGGGPCPPSLLERLASHWFLFLLILVVNFLLAGVLFGGYGVPKLFRDDPELYADGLLFFDRFPTLTPFQNSPLILTLAAMTIMLAIVWTFILLSETARNENLPLLDRNVHLRRLRDEALPLVAFALAAVLFPADAELSHGWKQTLLALIGVGLGILATWLAVTFSYHVGPRLARIGLVTLLVELFATRTAFGKKRRGELTERDRREHGAFLWFMLVQLSLLSIVTRWKIIIPPVAILMLIGWVFFLYFVLRWLRPLPRLVSLALLVGIVLVTGSARYKHSFPNIVDESGDSLYPRASRLAYDSAVRTRAGSRLVDPITSLDNWQRFARAKTGKERPPLVVVSTQGGAYRAAFWTAVVLDRLEVASGADGPIPGFTSSLRLITGASGGMVGAAYYAALRTEEGQRRAVVDQMNFDTRESRRTGVHKTRFPIPRDTLSPVIQQLVQEDIYTVILPGRTSRDRGSVLESQWLTLQRSFAELAEGEREGWRPSLLLSPMIVETGQQLAITNLNLVSLDAVSCNLPDAAALRTDQVPLCPVEEFFALFGASHNTFQVATAVRMNASFPYVSPAVSLPTVPSRRIVDAGYYDNFGVAIAVEWLAQPGVVAWLEKNVPRVILIEIRAFPPGDRNDEGAPFALRWATSPLEGVGAARGPGNVFRNDSALRRLRDMMPNVQIDSVVFTNFAGSSEVGMSWYTTGEELEELYKQWDSNAESLRSLEALW